METNRCDAARRNHETYSSNETSCEPTAEERAAATEGDRQAADRAADARREAYIGSDEDVGGQCVRASCDASKTVNHSDDDHRLRDSLRTAKIDPPLQDDVAGNAIIGALGGGAVAGVQSAAAGASGRTIMAQAGKAVVGSLAQDAVHERVKDAAGVVATHIAESRPPVETSPATVGRSSTRATSEVVTEPNRSVDTTPLPIPYLPAIKG